MNNYLEVKHETTEDKLFSSFIKQQQELAERQIREQWDCYDNGCFGHLDGVIDFTETLITQIITNTGEELLKLVEGERRAYLIPKEQRHDYDNGFNQALDTFKQHITNVTGEENLLDDKK